jgi:hypothetical protein
MQAYGWNTDHSIQPLCLQQATLLFSLATFSAENLHCRGTRRLRPRRHPRTAPASRACLFQLTNPEEGFLACQAKFCSDCTFPWITEFD